MHKQDDEKIAASLTIHDAADMTPEGRKKIAAWLRRHANDLIKDATTTPIGSAGATCVCRSCLEP